MSPWDGVAEVVRQGIVEASRVARAALLLALFHGEVTLESFFGNPRRRWQRSSLGLLCGVPGPGGELRVGPARVLQGLRV